jgi:large subunit ribosomal protein L23
MSISKTISLRPRLNEKTYALSKTVNKHAIARAVEAQFEVKVIAVNTANITGKAKRIISINGKRSKNAEGKRNDIKKAYVTLAKGESLPFFNAVEESEQKEQALQEKLDKAAEKASEKKSAPARRGLLRGKKDKSDSEVEKEVK